MELFKMLVKVGAEYMRSVIYLLSVVSTKSQD
jgi:hypothetical protein